MDEVLAAMKEASVPCGPILSTADIYAEEQYRARNMFHTVKPPSGKTLPYKKEQLDVPGEELQKMLTVFFSKAGAQHTCKQLRFKQIKFLRHLHVGSFQAACLESVRWLPGFRILQVGIESAQLSVQRLQSQ